MSPSKVARYALLSAFYTLNLHFVTHQAGSTQLLTKPFLVFVAS